MRAGRLVVSTAEDLEGDIGYARRWRHDSASQPSHYEDVQLLKFSTSKGEEAHAEKAYITLLTRKSGGGEDAGDREKDRRDDPSPLTRRLLGRLKSADVDEEEPLSISGGEPSVNVVFSTPTLFWTSC